MVKIDIISGFLGAGKTTLIKKFIQEAFQGEKLVLIENEFGEIGVDGGFLQDAGIEIKEMNSGCICCSLVGDFATSLKEVIETYHPERIIIEPSGVGKLSDVEKAVKNLDTDVAVTVNRKIAVVNAAKAKMYAKNFGEFFINQVEHADAVVLSRTADITEEKLEQSITLLRQYNDQATMITTPWDKLDGADMLHTIEYQNQLEESLLKEVHHHEHHEHHEGCGCGGHHGHHEHHEHHEGCGCGGHHEHHEHHEGCGCGGHHEHHEHHEGCGCGGHHGHHEHHEGCGCGEHHGHHHADDVFTSWGIETASKYEYDSMNELLAELENEHEYGSILRAKGMLECENGKWVYFDYVPGEVEVREGSPCTTGKICVIGANINEESIMKLFKK